jgi:hypothetical protein
MFWADKMRMQCNIFVICTAKDWLDIINIVVGIIATSVATGVLIMGADYFRKIKKRRREAEFAFYARFTAHLNQLLAIFADDLGDASASIKKTPHALYHFVSAYERGTVGTNNFDFFEDTSVKRYYVNTATRVLNFLQTVDGQIPIGADWYNDIDELTVQLSETLFPRFEYVDIENADEAATKLIGTLNRLLNAMKTQRKA